jgi:hypothetical protein
VGGVFGANSTQEEFLLRDQSTLHLIGNTLTNHNAADYYFNSNEGGGGDLQTDTEGARSSLNAGPKQMKPAHSGGNLLSVSPSGAGLENTATIQVGSRNLQFAQSSQAGLLVGGQKIQSNSATNISAAKKKPAPTKVPTVMPAINQRMSKDQRLQGLPNSNLDDT